MNQKVLDQLREWFTEFFSFDPKKQINEHILINLLAENPLEKRDGFKCQFFTRTNRYIIIALSTYLGASFLSRKPRAGEDWHRGRDLSDGSFSQATWNKIRHDIIRNEIVKVSKITLEKQKLIWYKSEMISAVTLYDVALDE